MPPPRLRVRWRARKANGRTKAQLSLDIGRAISAGQELRPLLAKLGYGPKTISLDQLKIGQPDNVDAGRRRAVSTASMRPGKLALNASAASLGQITALIAPLAPALAARLNAMGASPGPARAETGARSRQECANRPIAAMRAPCSISTRRSSRASPPSPQSRRVAAIRGIDLDALGRSEIGIEVETVVGAGRRPAGAARARPRRSRRATARRNSRDRRPARGARRCG